MLPICLSTFVSGSISDFGDNFPFTIHAAGRLLYMTLLTLFLKLLLRIPLLEYQDLYSQGYLKKSLLPEEKKKKNSHFQTNMDTEGRRGIFTREMSSSSFLSHMPDIFCPYS